MRYTTVIDISDMAEIYRNHNTVLVYLHMALKSGYHDDDRDTCRTSIRDLAWRLHMTISAVRHALAILDKADLVKRQGDAYHVKKWTIEAPPSPRPRKKTGDSNTGNLGEKMDQQIREYQERVINAVREMSRSELESWLEELKSGRSIRHHGVQIPANQRNIEWLTNYIDKL